MIKTIEISNFQTHKDTTINLSKGVNVFKGRSHSGKSSITRALEWVLLNSLRGDYFVSWFRGKKELTSVGVEFDDGGYIIRQKGNGVNGYQLSTHEDPIEAIRTDLPEEVSSITRMGKINIQAQDELYYMLKETPGTVAKELNRLVGLDIIDSTLTKLNKLENENKVKLNLLEKDSLEVKVNLKELDYLDTLEKEVVQIENMWVEYQRLIRKKDKIIELSESLSEVEGVIQETSAWLSIKTPVDELFQLIKERQQLNNTFIKLEDVYASINEQEIVRLSSADRVRIAKDREEQIINSKEYKNQFCPKCGAHSDHWRKK
jgi:AAA15 family ATPase/GTPase